MAEIAIKIRVAVAVVLGGPLIYFAWLVIFLAPNYWVEILQKNPTVVLPLWFNLHLRILGKYLFL